VSNVCWKQNILLEKKGTGFCCSEYSVGKKIRYGFLLFWASELISNGSELLLLVPSIAGVIGTIVLPVLAAVPDGMMILFSGLGSKATFAHEVQVGVGTLAGSTVMLLTIPW
jgi:hypothetical protein